MCQRQAHGCGSSLLCNPATDPVQVPFSVWQVKGAGNGKRVGFRHCHAPSKGDSITYLMFPSLKKDHC